MYIYILHCMFCKCKMTGICFCFVLIFCLFFFSFFFFFPISHRPNKGFGLLLTTLDKDIYKEIQVLYSILEGSNEKDPRNRFSLI